MTTYDRQTAGMRDSDTMSGTRRWDDYSDTYRSDWENRYGQNKRWDEHEHAYRYGWESAQDSRWRDRDFHDVESDLQSGFNDFRDRYYNEHKGHDVSDHKTMGGKIEHAWENFKDTVREGWERARMGFDR